ncbi:MAG: alpha-amylase family glycosyl hydrolase [Actinomycetales bacterium]
MTRRRHVLAAMVATVLAVTATASTAGTALAEGSTGPSEHRPAAAEHSLRSPETGENFYFVMADRFANGDTTNDTGGLGDDPMVSGFDPTKTGFYNGGDLAGLRQRLDYIEGLGTTAIWLTPSFKNRAVQPADGSAGYHGYWVTDFTQIDPHLGSNDELRGLIDDAHGRGMKVYFDIITNHTADVIGYNTTDQAGQTTFSQRLPYVSKDQVPYRAADGSVFDDRDYAGTNSFPALDAQTSFPYQPVVPEQDADLKVPAWLNDPTLYHNRGDTTFVGENSQYGDFFGLDDLFTENPTVVNGFIDVYQTWIGDFGIDGFRIDTMKHVDDAFWQQFGPQVLQYAHDHGKPEFFMFGEVFDTTRPNTSVYTTRDKMQAVLDFPFQDAARRYASQNGSSQSLADFFAGDDWYTDADSNAYQLPTFLGNHDMGRIGWMLQSDNPGASDAEILQRDRLAHELMYFSRGNPVIYYGDEQGFTGSGGDQVARQTLFASQVPQYLDDDLIGTDATHAQDNYDTTHPLYTSIGDLAAVVREHPALRDGAMQVRTASDGPGIFAFSRTRVDEQREYLVAINNSTSEQTATMATYGIDRGYSQIYGDGARYVVSDGDGQVSVTVPALSTVVYAMTGTIGESKRAPKIYQHTPKPAEADPSRMQLRASVFGPSLYEVTFQMQAPGGGWQNVGTDDNAPYQVFVDTADIDPGTRLQFRAVVLDNQGNTRKSQTRSARVPAPLATMTAPAAGALVRGEVTVQAQVNPEHGDNVVQLQRKVGDGDWTWLGRDDSSPVYTAVDTVDGLGPAGTQVSYRARVMSGDRVLSVSEPVTVGIAGPPVETATLAYQRPGGDFGDWGLHLWGSGIDPALLSSIAWDAPMPPTRIEGDWAYFDIPLTSDTEPVNFIVHTPGGDTVPTTREPGGDRSFVPSTNPQVWVVQGDATVYPSQP